MNGKRLPLCLCLPISLPVQSVFVHSLPSLIHAYLSAFSLLVLFSQTSSSPSLYLLFHPNLFPPPPLRVAHPEPHALLSASLPFATFTPTFIFTLHSSLLSLSLSLSTCYLSSFLFSPSVYQQSLPLSPYPASLQLFIFKFLVFLSTTFLSLSFNSTSCSSLELPIRLVILVSIKFSSSI